MPDHDDELVDHDAPEAEDHDEGWRERLRGGGVGTEDETIVGDAGPTDIPPGTDGEGTTGLVTTDEPVDHLDV